MTGTMATVDDRVAFLVAPMFFPAASYYNLAGVLTDVHMQYRLQVRLHGAYHPVMQHACHAMPVPHF
jgi:hypothetical protein